MHVHIDYDTFRATPALNYVKSLLYCRSGFLQIVILHVPQLIYFFLNSKIVVVLILQRLNLLVIHSN